MSEQAKKFYQENAKHHVIDGSADDGLTVSITGLMEAYYAHRLKEELEKLKVKDPINPALKHRDMINEGYKNVGRADIIQKLLKTTEQ